MNWGIIGSSPVTPGLAAQLESHRITVPDTELVHWFEFVDELQIIPFPMRVLCHDTPALDCRTYWGSHGCDLPRGHVPPCMCSCAWEDDDGEFDQTNWLTDPMNVGGPPYYGSDTRFYGEDSP